MKKAFFSEENQNDVQQQVKQIQNVYIMRNPQMAQYSLLDLYDPRNLQKQHRLYVLNTPSVLSQISLTVAAPDLFIQKLRSLYMFVLIVGHQANNSINSSTQDIMCVNEMKKILYAMLKCFYMETHIGSPPTKYMALFMQQIQQQLFSCPNPICIIPELINKYPKIDQFFIDIFMFQVKLIEQKLHTIDDNYLIAQLLKNKFSLQCKFVTDREMVIAGFTIEVTINTICIFNETKPTLHHYLDVGQEWLDVSKVGSFSESVFDKMDRSYIKDLSGIGSILGSRNNDTQQLDKTKYSIYSSCHFSQHLEGQREEKNDKKGDKYLTMKKLQQQKLQRSFYIIEMEEDPKQDLPPLYRNQSILNLQIQEDQENQSNQLTNKIYSDTNLPQIYQEKAKQSLKQSVKVHKNLIKRESHAERETNEEDFQQGKRQIDKYEFKILRKNFQPPKRIQKNSSQEQTLKLRKSRSDPSFILLPAKNTLHQNIQSKNRPETCTQPNCSPPPITKFSCKVKTNLKIRNPSNHEQQIHSPLMRQKYVGQIKQSEMVRPINLDYNFMTIKR